MAKITEPFGYIIKPFDDKELSSAIEKALGGNPKERLWFDAGRRRNDKFWIFAFTIFYKYFCINKHEKIYEKNDR